DSEPRGAAPRFLLAALDESSTWQRLMGLMSRELQKEAATERDPLEGMRRSLRGAPMPTAVLRDLMTSVMQVSVDGDERAGYRVRLQSQGHSMTEYLVRE